MYRVSNSVIGILNFLTFVLSIPILGGGLWLARQSGICERFLQWPVITIGAFIMVVSLAGFVGACFRVSWLLWLYLLLMFLLILLLMSFTIFAFVVTNKGSGKAISDRGYGEYRLGDYSRWLQNRVENPENWAKIRSCIADAGVCSGSGGSGSLLGQNLSGFESGCCNRPSWCANSPDPDCDLWNAAGDRLCYDCSSCKAGVLANLKRDWRKVALVNIVVLVVLILVYSVGCCAFRNNRRTDTDYGYGTNRMTKSRPSPFPWSY